MSLMINGKFQDQGSIQFNRLPSTVQHEASLGSFINSLMKQLFMFAKNDLPINFYSESLNNYSV